jgi:hypothetical protein
MDITELDEHTLDKVYEVLEAVEGDLIDSPQLHKRFRRNASRRFVGFTAYSIARAEGGENHPFVQAYTLRELLKDGLIDLAPAFGLILSTRQSGFDRPTLSVQLSLDPKEKWKNGIFNNSRHGIFSVSFPENQIEGLTSHGLPVSFRKIRFDTAAEAAQKFLAYVAKLVPTSVER